MNTFFSRLTSGRRGSCPPAFLPSRGRRPAREIATRELRSEWSISKPGQAPPPPPGPSGRASQLEARPGLAAAPGASRRPKSARVSGDFPPAFLPSRGRRPAREIATRELRSEWSISKPGQALPPPSGPSGRASQLEARPGPAAAPGASRLSRLGLSLSALLVSAFLVIVGAPASFADPSPDPDLAQSVAAHEEWSNEATEISVGHVDLGPRLIDGQWRAGLRHDADGGAVWRDPNQTVLRVSDAAIMTAPDSADYPFLADVAGKPVYVVPQTQNPNVVWLGWNTQDPAVTATIDRGLTMRVGPVSGPGRAWLFLQSGTFGKPLLLADSAAAPGDVWIDSGTHVHANWAFSAPGTYTATVTFLGTTTAGEAVSASTTLRFAVGDAASASEALAQSAPATSSAAATSGSAAQGAGSSGSAPSGGASQGTGSEVSNPGASASSSEGGLPDWAFIVIIAVAILSVLIIGALVVARSRRSRAEQAAAIAEADSILAPLPTAPGEERGEATPASSDSAPTQGKGSGKRGPGLVDRGGEQ